jgi:hypothetical protein
MSSPFNLRLRDHNCSPSLFRDLSFYQENESISFQNREMRQLAGSDQS